MTLLSEDPTYLAGALVLVSVFFLISLKVTQQGKYLFRAGAALALALAVVLIEWVWVTDNERIEQVVHELRTAVLKSDAEGVLAFMTPDVIYTESETSRSAEATRAFIRANIGNIHFDFVRIADLRTNVGSQSHRGTAEFRAFTRGGLRSTSNASEPITTVTRWSLGFRETEPGRWKVTRISRIETSGSFQGVRG
jgi:ketosteroid isomerase-like protein